VQVGQRVAAGTPLMSVVPLDQVWVEANFKEVQLRRMRIGQPVTLSADLYGSKVEYRGRVAGLGAGTGAAFALLPAQNATGNWIKVVQRVPVRIALDPKELAAHPLRVGLSMEATVDAADGGAPRWPRPRRAPAAAPQVFEPRRAADAASRASSPQPRRRAPAAGPRGAPRRAKLAVPRRPHVSAEPPATRRRPRPRRRRRPRRRLRAAAGQRARAGHAGAVAGHVHERARLVDRQRVDPGHRRRHGRQPGAGHLGHHLVRRGQRHRGAADRLADAALRPGAAVHASVLLFVLASWLCGLAPNIEMLIFFRVLQGLVAGPMIPLSQTLLLASYPPALAGLAMAMWGMTTLVAPVVGPLLGGWITDNISWPWIFYINVPVGLFAAGSPGRSTAAATPARARAAGQRGPGLLVLWVGALQLMLDKGKELDWFESTARSSCWAWWRWSAGRVLPGLGADRPHPWSTCAVRAAQLRVGVLALSVAYGLFFGNVVLLPLWLQQWMGYTATWAGMATGAGGVLAIVLSPWVGATSAHRPAQAGHLRLRRLRLVLWMRSQLQHRRPTFHDPAAHRAAGRGDGVLLHPAAAIVFAG
jgi:MFS family permease